MIDGKPLAGERILITGASSGLGAHFARLAVDAGAEVVVAARRVDALDALVAELRDAGGTAEALALDVTDSASVDGVFAALEGRLPTVLVNNAGMEPGVFSFLDLDEAGWDATINTNLKGTWLMARAAARAWREAGQGGNIVNIASILAFRQQKGVTPYAVSKAGVVQLTKQIALEGARFSLRCNALAPGYFRSAVSERLLDSPEAEAFLRPIPQRRAGVLEDYDGAFLLLAGRASAHMTGQVITVDGGHLVSSL